MSGYITEYLNVWLLVPTKKFFKEKYCFDTATALSNKIQKHYKRYGK